MKNNTILFFFIILLVAAAFRLSGINWDANQHLHPDERFLTMVANGISWPKTIGEYFDTSRSSLNPHNRGFYFYVYGTFPLFLVKAIAEVLGRGDYNNLTLIGRAVSGLFDLGTTVLVFLITKQIVKSKAQMTNVKSGSKLKFCHLDLGFWISPYVSMFLYGAMVLPIQLSHFFTVDPYLTFFLTLSFYLLIDLLVTCSRPTGSRVTLLGLSFGLAVASKISALLFLPVIGVAWLFAIRRNNRTRLFISGLLFLAIFYFTLRLAQPYLFATGNLLNPTLNPAVLSNWKELKSFDNPSNLFPPAVQWIGTAPLLPFVQMVFFGMGLPMAIIIVASLVWLLTQIRQTKLFLFLFWIFLFLVYQSLQFAKPMRYFSPIYPMLAIAAGVFAGHSLCWIKKKSPHWIIGLLLLWPLAFLSIYLRPNTRVAASQWIFQNISKGSTLAVEHWDDPLPLCLPQQPCSQYTILTLPVFDPETPAKWQAINQILETADYLILTSNRGYGAIQREKYRFPETNAHYRNLFSGRSEFAFVIQFTSRPTIPIPFLRICLPVPGFSYGITADTMRDCPSNGVSFIDDYSDETFTVYDHPKVLIFKKEVTGN